MSYLPNLKSKYLDNIDNSDLNKNIIFGNIVFRDLINTDNYLNN